MLGWTAPHLTQFVMLKFASEKLWHIGTILLGPEGEAREITQPCRQSQLPSKVIPPLSIIGIAPEFYSHTGPKSCQGSELKAWRWFFRARITEKGTEQNAGHTTCRAACFTWFLTKNRLCTCDWKEMHILPSLTSRCFVSVLRDWPFHCGSPGGSCWRIEPRCQEDRQTPQPSPHLSNATSTEGLLTCFIF